MVLFSSVSVLVAPTREVSASGRVIIWSAVAAADKVVV